MHMMAVVNLVGSAVHPVVLLMYMMAYAVHQVRLLMHMMAIVDLVGNVEYTQVCFLM